MRDLLLRQLPDTTGTAGEPADRSAAAETRRMSSGNGWVYLRLEELPSQISTENGCWRDAARGTETRPPALRRRRNTTPPVDPNVFQTLSSAHNAAIARRRIFYPQGEFMMITLTSTMVLRVPDCQSHCMARCS